MNGDFRYICSDKTDDPHIYKDLIRRAVGLIKNGSYNCDEYFEQAARIIREIDSPQRPKEGKYKIPHKFLFQHIRTTASATCGSYDASLGMDESIARELIYETAKGYFIRDCKYSKEYGEKMQSIYEEPGKVMLYHLIQHSNRSRPTEEVLKSVNVVGLRQSLHDERCCCKTNRTMRQSTDKDFSYIDMISTEPGDAIILSVPEDAFNTENPVPIWGADGHTVSVFDNPSYILPEYVVGATIKETQSFVQNQIPYEERKKYRYKFVEGSIHAINKMPEKDMGL